MSNFSSRNPSPTRDRSYGASSSSLAHALDFTVPKTPSPENPRVNGDLANIAQFSASNVHPHIMGPPLGQPQFTFSGPGGSDRVAVPGVNQPSTELSRLFKSIALTANAAGDAALAGHGVQAEIMQIQASIAALSAMASSTPTNNGYNNNGKGKNTYLNAFAYDPGNDTHPMQETAEMSRKRCASSVAGPAVMKTMKMENGASDSTTSVPKSNLSLLSTPYTPITNQNPSIQDIFISPLPPTSSTSMHHRMTSLPTTPIDRAPWIDHPAMHRRHQHSASVDGLGIPSFAPRGTVFEGSNDFNMTPVGSPTFEQLYDGTMHTPDKHARGRSLHLRSFHTNGSDSLASALDSMNFPSFHSTPLNLSPTSPNDAAEYSFDTAEFTFDDSDPGNESDHFSRTRSLSRGDELPIAQRDALERVFLEFLNKICSNLEAKDAKGELIHQTLMAKKMQRLDEFPDFRPFKFRIAALTNAFIEELDSQGWGDIPIKKARFFLWNSPLICRYTDEGRKSKSKGNHVWSVDAKKCDDGWIFRPFPRRVVGTPEIAHVGSLWKFTPRIWDPQLGRPNAIIHYFSPSLPPWLSWRDDTLSGIPPPNTNKIEFTVEARFDTDGVQNHLSENYAVPVVPNARSESSTSSKGSHEPMSQFHRTVSDSVVPRIGPPRPSIQQQLDGQSDVQVVQVLNAAARSVAHAQSHIVTSPSLSDEHVPDFRSLAQQQRILSTVAQALDHPIKTEESLESPLASVGRAVVFQAARQAETDRHTSYGTSTTASAPVTVNDVTVKTQDIVAQAVEMHMISPDSSDVEVMMTASSLLRQQNHGSPTPSFVNPGQVYQDRSHSTS